VPPPLMIKFTFLPVLLLISKHLSVAAPNVVWVVIISKICIDWHYTAFYRLLLPNTTTFFNIFERYNNFASQQNWPCQDVYSPKCWTGKHIKALLGEKAQPLVYCCTKRFMTTTINCINRPRKTNFQNAVRDPVRK